MNSPTRFQEPGCPLPHAVRLPSWDSGRCTPASGGRAEEAAPETAVGAGLARRPEAGGRRSPPPGLGGEDTPAQEPRRGAAIRVGGSFSSGRSGHLGAARGLILPGGRWAAARGTAGAALRALGSHKTWGHPGRRRGPDTLRGSAASRRKTAAYLSLRHPSFCRLEFSLQVAGTGEHLPPRVVGYAQELERHRGLIQPARRELVGSSEPRRAPAAVGVQTPMCAVPDSSIPARGP
nr:unnamed protein product [Rangifer tarandus platyrhynchus]